MANRFTENLKTVIKSKGSWKEQTDLNGCRQNYISHKAPFMREYLLSVILLLDTGENLNGRGA